MRTVSPAALRASSWGWRHAGRSDWAVRDLDLVAEPGERILLLGTSGSGKSTLLAALAGVLGGDEEGDEAGELSVDGQHPSAAHGRSGLLLQDPDSQVVLARVGDDVAFGCENLGVPRDEIWQRVSESLAAVGLHRALDYPTGHLSGGQKQRLALAGVLAMRPGLLLLDEPTANLDPEGVREVRDAVAHVAEATGATLVVVEHRVDVWADLVDRVVVLERGAVVADGSPDAVFGSESERLERTGVWLPKRAAPQRRAGTVPTRSGRGPLLSAADLEIGRNRGASIAAGLDLVLDEASMTVISGSNGSGKTTLALTLGGLIAPLGGELRATPMLAENASSEPIRWTSRQLLTRIGSVFQSPEHQFVAQSVRAELAVGPRALRRSPSGVTARIDELLDRLQLSALADANPFTLSGGQKRRLSVATALATEPRLVILDEPTYGQDASTWRELVALLGELREAGHAILAVSHDPELAPATDAHEWRMPSAVEDVALEQAGARR